MIFLLLYFLYFLSFHIVFVFFILFIYKQPLLFPISSFKFIPALIPIPVSSTSSILFANAALN